MKIIIRNIKAPVVNTEGAALTRAGDMLKKQHIAYKALAISKKSVDARKSPDICYLCSVTAEVEAAPDDALLARLDAVVLSEDEISFTCGNIPLEAPPVVVGFGPAGMFAALLLAENGYRPVVIERGGDVRSRQAAVERFNKSRVLDTASNIQFGAGGAGTFSDGKLVTRINDSRCSYVLRRLIEFGAPADIAVNAKPHIGTDLLTGIVDRIAERIVALGGIIHYNTEMLGINKDGTGKAVSVSTPSGELSCGALVLAPGHSARDTYGYLIKSGYVIEPKAFSVGVRIEHLQQDINEAMYKSAAPLLPPAEYGLSRRNGERGVYSFCMCPGGEVVAAASEEGGVVTNGMSRHARNGRNANSALAVSVLTEDYGNDPLRAIEFQRGLERAAFRAAGGNYNAPLQTVGDFMTGKTGSEPTRVEPTYMGGSRCTLCSMDSILPSFVCSMLREGIHDFGRKIRGFDAPYALLTGVESRTSAPLRIKREADMTAIGHGNIYPCGEGAGYAGGITSAAVDGLSVAVAIMEKYREEPYAV